MREYRGVFRRLAGVLIIVVAIDLASITAMAPTSQVTFQQVGQPGEKSSPLEERYAGMLPSWAILVIGVGIGVWLFSWGASSSRKFAQEMRDA